MATESEKLIGAITSLESTIKSLPTGQGRNTGFESLSEALTRTAEALETHKQAMQDQSTITRELIDAQSKTADDQKDSDKKNQSQTGKLAKAIEGLRKDFPETISALKGLGTGLGKLAGGLGGGLGKTIGGFGNMIKGLKGVLTKFPIFGTGFKIAKEVLGGMTKVFKMGITLGTKFAKIMVGLPLQIVGSVAKIGHSFRTDIIETVGNAVRGLSEFIDINDGLGKSISDMSTSSALSFDKFLNVQSELVQLFGYGPGGLAAMLGHAGQALKDMGQFADVAGNSITKSADNFVYFYKATQSLGMAGEDIAYITAEAVKNGESIYSAMDSVLVAVNTTADSFGLDRKKMSKNFFELRKDITNFGHLSNSQLSETTAKLTQMGLSMKEAAAVFGKIDTFESAAQTSAMLSQTFGMNLDALKLLRAEKPEEIIEQFRDAMLSTGRSFDDLNRHEKSLMASHTGLSAEALKMTMNYRNLGMSYSDIQKKMKEDDPTQRQIKNLELMSGSLKKIQKTLQGDNIFKNFTDGVLETMKAASGLSPILLRVSERFEDFFVSGLKVSGKAKSALEKAFKPFVDVLEDMVGDGKNKKGLLDAKRFKKTFESFATGVGGFLGRAFSGNESVLELQDEFRNYISKGTAYDSIMSKGNIVGELFKSSGKLIGQFLKGFAALGPGLIDVVDKSLTSAVDFLLGYQSESEGNNSITSILKDIFGLNSDDSMAIRETFNKLIEFLVGTSGPFMRLFTWVNSKFLGLAGDMASIAAEAFMKSMPVLNWFTSDYKTNLLKGREIASKEKSKGSASSILALAKEMDEYENELLGLNDNEEKLSELTGKMEYLISDLERRGTQQEKSRLTEFFKRTDQSKSKLLDARIAEENVEELLGLASFLKDGNIDNLRKNASSYDLTIKDVKKVKDDVASAKSSLLGQGGMALLKSVPGGATVTQYDAGDQVIGGKDGGPIVNAIAYAGNAANALIKGMEYLMTPSNLLPTMKTVSSGPSELKICLQVDGKTLTEVCLDNDIVGEMTKPGKGRKYIDGNAIIDASGNAVQGSSL